jgi:hypothetical protein
MVQESVDGLVSRKSLPALIRVTGRNDEKGYHSDTPRVNPNYTH